MFSYFLVKRCKKLPANFIQAQRDYFGAHTYELLEKPGIPCTSLLFRSNPTFLQFLFVHFDTTAVTDFYALPLEEGEFCRIAAHVGFNSKN